MNIREKRVSLKAICVGKEEKQCCEITRPFDCEEWFVKTDDFEIFANTGTKIVTNKIFYSQFLNRFSKVRDFPTEIFLEKTFCQVTEERYV